MKTGRAGGLTEVALDGRCVKQGKVPRCQQVRNMGLSPGAKGRPMRAPAPFQPFASIIVPSLSEGAGMEAAASAFLRQDYPAYEVLFVMDDPDASCYPALERLRRRDPRVRLVLADPAVVGAWSSRLMVAQLAGVRHAEPWSEVLAFADSGAIPGRRWLAGLVSPLEDPEVAASTGLRHSASRPAGGGLAVRRSRFADAPYLALPRPTETGSLDDSMPTLDMRLVFAPGLVVAVPEEGPVSDLSCLVFGLGHGTPTAEY